ncbi:hypothetical protein N42HA_01709 [Lactococcus lactis]|nr:hypothetical protein [Lactococcus lactis]
MGEHRFNSHINSRLDCNPFLPSNLYGCTTHFKYGDLTLKKSAIEGFVGEKVKENDYLKNSKITVSLFKNKIKIDIKGEIIPRVEVAQKAQVLEQEIIEGLKSFFGLEHTVKLKVKVNTLSKDDSPKRQRVI